MSLKTLAKLIKYAAVEGVILISLTTANQAQAISFGGSTYSLTTVDSWTGAQAQAVAAGGNLTTINDAAEQAFLVSAFDGSELFWIGFNDAAVEGTFVWVSGEPVTYTNWAGGEPNNLVNEDFTVMNWGVAGFWNDLYNDYPVRLRGIIEVKDAAVPEPLTMLGVGTALGFGTFFKRRLAKTKSDK